MKTPVGVVPLLWLYTKAHETGVPVIYDPFKAGAYSSGLQNKIKSIEFLSI